MFYFYLFFSVLILFSYHCNKLLKIKPSQILCIKCLLFMTCILNFYWKEIWGIRCPNLPIAISGVTKNRIWAIFVCTGNFSFTYFLGFFDLLFCFHWFCSKQKVGVKGSKLLTKSYWDLYSSNNTSFLTNEIYKKVNFTSSHWWNWGIMLSLRIHVELDSLKGSQLAKYKSIFPTWRCHKIYIGYIYRVEAGGLKSSKYTSKFNFFCEYVTFGEISWKIYILTTYS